MPLCGSRAAPSPFYPPAGRAAIQDLSGQGDVALFRRYDLMRRWAESGAIDVESAAKGDTPKDLAQNRRIEFRLTSAD